MYTYIHTATPIPTSILSHLDNTTKKCRCMHVFWSIRFLLEKVYQLWVISKCKPGSEKYYRTLKVLIRQELKASEPHTANTMEAWKGNEWRATEACIEGLYWSPTGYESRYYHYTTLHWLKSLHTCMVCLRSREGGGWRNGDRQYLGHMDILEDSYMGGWN